MSSMVTTVASLEFKGIINNVSDIKKFKDFVITHPNLSLCYVYYKNNKMNTNIHYVGYTGQKGINKYKYLRNHPKMGNMIKNLQRGIHIRIYTKYTENSLIVLFNPSLNQATGRITEFGKNLRTISSIDEYNSDLPLTFGEIIDSSHYQLNNMIKKNKKKNSELEKDYKYCYTKSCGYLMYNYEKGWRLPFIHETILKIFIEKKNDNSYNEINILYHMLLNDNTNHIYYNILDLLTHYKLYSILKYCKLKDVYSSYVIINNILKKHISWHLNKYDKNIENILLRIIGSKTYKSIICCDILETLNEKKYLLEIKDILDCDVWYMYHKCKYITNGVYLWLFKNNMLMKIDYFEKESNISDPFNYDYKIYHTIMEYIRSKDPYAYNDHGLRFCRSLGYV